MSISKYMRNMERTVAGQNGEIILYKVKLWLLATL